MTTLTITAKGQITLKKDLLKHLGVGPGDKIDVTPMPYHRIEVAVARKRGDISSVFGMLKRSDGPTLTIEEMNEIIADGWAGKRRP